MLLWAAAMAELSQTLAGLEQTRTSLEGGASLDAAGWGALMALLQAVQQRQVAWEQWPALQAWCTQRYGSMLRL